MNVAHLLTRAPARADALPKNAYGKVLKRELRDRLAGRVDDKG